MHEGHGAALKSRRHLTGAGTEGRRHETTEIAKALKIGRASVYRVLATGD
jgi:hypothetical protein